MHGWMTNRHEGCVSTMLTDSGLSIALPVRRFKGLCDEMEGARRKAPAYRVLSVLTTDRFGPNRKRRTRLLSWRRGSSAACMHHRFGDSLRFVLRLRLKR
jgi:hypothetical protein